MKDELLQKINKVDCGIINLENSNEEGSHWTAYKNNDKKYYFDSYGNAPPPKELVKYLAPKILFIITKYLKIIMIHQFAAIYA
jgi:hypothetical protein